MISFDSRTFGLQFTILVMTPITICRVLSEVADYSEPRFEASGSMKQGMYLPRSHVWEELYDPIYVLLRAVHRRDFLTSIERFNTL